MGTYISKKIGESKYFNNDTFDTKKKSYDVKIGCFYSNDITDYDYTIHLNEYFDEYFYENDDNSNHVLVDDMLDNDCVITKK